jgi:hypothetical protein
MHQDVLWQAGADEDQGYWGIPPWAKHKLDPPGPNVIKLFCQKFTNFLNKLKRFVPGKPFQPSLMFLVKQMPALLKNLSGNPL